MYNDISFASTLRKDNLPHWNPGRNHCTGHRWLPAPPSHHTGSTSLFGYRGIWGTKQNDE